MTTMEKTPGAGDVFSPKDLSPEHLAVAFLVHRITTLPRESLADLASLAPELMSCESAETFREIMETMREILFPELLGKVTESPFDAGQRPSGLRARMEHIGGRIKDLRLAAGLTQVGLAERARLPQSHISRLEAGQHSPSHKTLERIAKALEVSISQIDPSYD